MNPQRLSIISLSLFFYFINIIYCQFSSTLNISKRATKQEQLYIKSDPLILTPYIEAGKDIEARLLAKVDPTLFLNVTSYSGYLTVDKEHNSSSFFWFFPAVGTEHLYENDDESDGEDEDTDYDHPYLKKLEKSSTKQDNARVNNSLPVVLWLQGGPGHSSLLGIFTENGPFQINDDLISIRENPYSWHKRYSMLYIDNPVGTGFSFTDKKGYVDNIPKVAKHLYTALRQFFKMFPILKNNEFFITGQSFAGKYIPAIGNEIYEQNKIESNDYINLQGLALGNAFSDPYNMLDYSEFAYKTGLIGLAGYREMKICEIQLKNNINTLEGKDYWESILLAFQRHSNYTNVYNIARTEEVNIDIFLEFINLPKIRNALHVGEQSFSDPTEVRSNLTPDFLTSAMHWVEKLLDVGLRIMYYSGNLDVIVAYPLSLNSYQLMKWKGSRKYLDAKRIPFYVNNSLKGYITKAENFAECVILNAGHMVPTDQPEAALELIDRFIKNEL